MTGSLAGPRCFGFLDSEEERRRELDYAAPNVDAAKELRHDRLHIGRRQRLVKTVFY
jgi:hypothetical protein